MKSAKKKLKIFFYSMDGIGHINACVGLAQALAERGHQIYFLTSPIFVGSYEKFGFKEIILISEEKTMNKQNEMDKKIHPLKAMSVMLKFLRESDLLSGKPPIEKLRQFNPDNEDFQKKMYTELKEIHPQIVDAIEREKPDLIIVDHFQVAPCIAYGKIPWALLLSSNPSFIFESPDIPPIMSGYPSYDRTRWEEFRKKFNETFKCSIHYYQNKINKDFGYPEVDKDLFLFKSPYMNIYGYPKELDYTDIVSLPDNFVQLDAFCRELPETFELPSEFKAKLKPEDKLIYVSMGSMGSIDVDLMKKIVSALSKSPHKFIISMGAFYEEYELGDNMWGQAYLPQTKILPLVDMVITHGGNNTVTESFKFGKPMLVMPLFADQYDNAQRLLEKGYGNRIDTYGFKDEELIGMIDQILNDQKMRQRCEQAAERIRNTNSKQQACEKIEQILENIKRF